MLKIQEIREIIKLIDQSSIEKFTFESNGEKIKLEKGSSQLVVTPTVVAAPIVQQETPAAQPVAIETITAPVQEVSEVVSQVEDPSLHKVTSPMVGTFYASSSPEEAAFVQNGDKVKPESIVCIVEAMKLFNEIEAEVSGEIVEILVKDGQLVEYGQPLFLVKEN